jgi:hypothetical protein
MAQDGCEPYIDIYIYMFPNHVDSQYLYLVPIPVSRCRVAVSHHQEKPQLKANIKLVMGYLSHSSWECPLFFSG